MGGSVFIIIHHNKSPRYKKGCTSWYNLISSTALKRPDAYFISLLVNESGNTTHGFESLGLLKVHHGIRHDDNHITLLNLTGRRSI